MLLVAFGMAIVLEYIQMLLPYRSFNINDLIANASGVLVGALIYPLITRISTNSVKIQNYGHNPVRI